MKNLEIREYFETRLKTELPENLYDHFSLFLMGSATYNAHGRFYDNDSFIVWSNSVEEDEKLLILQIIDKIFKEMGVNNCPERMNVFDPAWRGTSTDWENRIRQLKVSENFKDQLDLLALKDNFLVWGKEADFLGELGESKYFLKLYCLDFLNFIFFQVNTRKAVLRFLTLSHFFNIKKTKTLDTVEKRIQLLDRKLNLSLESLSDFQNTKLTLRKRLKVRVILFRGYLKFFIGYLREGS